MRIIIAPDSFKECLSAREVALSLKKGFESELSSALVDIFPMADGGEGTLDALVYSTKGSKVDLQATGPLGEETTSGYGILGDGQTVVIEVAQIAGLQMTFKRNPMITTSYGLGELINHALNKGFRKFIICLGGSATNDGGIGMLQALGGLFLNEKNEHVSPNGGALGSVISVNLSNMNHLLAECEIVVASDVENVLCGPEGATYVFGPQKGANKQDIVTLDEGMKHFATVCEKELGKSLQSIPGAGAAGGLGFAFLILGAKIQSGAKIVAQSIRLEQQIKSADWVITGEGQSDYQTLYGKVPIYVAKIAKQYKVKTMLISGSLGSGYEQLYNYFDSCQSITKGPISVEDSMKNAKELLFDSSRDLARLIKLIDCK
ncbi:glycerate kinase [Bacillus sp. sid0103]|uniref:glycerate kinase n=1 Tax=Bacillus sp. sid0103 TaxID=2856337 RepID=UPI001C473060|nr:glycerate kinase [Bacillus sp. sid0103]MBV7508900.1 glycerate kinase [Bacillus sp. sid0103]